MNADLKVYNYPNGEIQRVQWLRLKDWVQLDFMRLKGDPGALSCFYDIYQNYLVPACPWIFENMVLFRLPEDIGLEELVDDSLTTSEYGRVIDLLTAACITLEKGVRIRSGKPVFQNDKAKALWDMLEKRDCIRIVKGKLPGTKIIPVENCSGYLSENEPEAELKVNANFFIMDKFDCATVFDHIGTPLGLCVKDGMVENPPLFHREALLVKKDGNVSVEELDVGQLEIEIGGKCYRHGINATIYSRPEHAKTPKGKGIKLVIVGCRVEAVKKGGNVPVPASGFVLCPWEETAITPGTTVIYHGLEDIRFGIQVGNSIIKDGVKTDHFISRFYNIRHLERVPFPPSLYPMNFSRDQAARIALGADCDGRPMLFWAEGAGKLGYTPGEDSTGASLSEMAQIAENLGMVNAVNLDGGGSAQILLKNKRALRISDRKKEDNSEAERLVPLGLVVR